MKKIIFLFFTFSILISCDKEKDVWSETYQIQNDLNIDREFETIEIDISKTPLKDFSLVDLETKERLITQLVDVDLDGKNDLLLFQPKIKANATKKYYLTFADHKKDSVINYCYSRFVPERTDDYTWENNRVAFRTFGPVAQKMVEDGVKGGTLSSGIDAWLKRVEYPIINLWYKRNDEKLGAYHTDHGEGLDNFHVGVSRGIGGTAVKVDTSYYFSKNFTSYKTIATGPLRTSFVLTYATWDAAGQQIDETKHISLDYGQNLTRFEIDVKGTKTISTGLTLHDKKGLTNQNDANFWISHWETIDDSEIGTGIVTTKPYFLGSEKYVTSKKDESNNFLHLNVVDGKVVYYSGFGWKKSKQFSTQKEWEIYLTDYSKKINTPLIVTEIKN
ncbi:DUF4861 domain-containing protein [Polaribacter reichenbachii]|uniref:DUF4861 domain-containing protein n=1 Tax=Polaribacter reichenbachii TaxID=996801 RepID=A0A1B8TVM8_9FLAO|nr:DUF4861 family protein [Polaribacter reichenbachii]APZ45459.1 DUF4861 domain-containing protein [Polaribacter reichenbachii]AUC19320.1 DUF4861 domain-containing protein [Polaribacter reichenbachii]OBY63525.1 hypothetical protein LPB301_11990 [Polaribacter reichenbachii]